MVSSTDSGVLFRDIIAIAAGSQSSVALRADGTVWTWGSQRARSAWRRHAGDAVPAGASTSHPRGRHRGSQHTYARLDRRRTRQCVGFEYARRAWQQYGHRKCHPSAVMGHAAKGALADVIAIACGTRFSLALSADGRVWAWGNNQESRLGDGTTHTRLTPVRVLTESSDALGGITQISAGATHSLALQGTRASVRMGVEQRRPPWRRNDYRSTSGRARHRQSPLRSGCHRYGTDAQSVDSRRRRCAHVGRERAGPTRP